MKFSTWKKSNLQLLAAPAGVVYQNNGQNSFEIFSGGLDEKLQHKSIIGDDIISRIPPGIGLISAPCVISREPGRLDVFLREPDQAVKWWWHDSKMPSSYQYGSEKLGGIITTAPSVCSWGKERMDVVARGTDNALWHRAWNYWNRSWTDWQSGYGYINSAPAIAAFGKNNLMVFAKGGDNIIWSQRGNGVKWNAGDWQFFGKPAGIELDDIDPVVGTSSGTSATMVVFVAGKNKEIYFSHSDRTFTEYSPGAAPWGNVPGIVDNGEQILPFSLAANGNHLFVWGSNHHLYEICWDVLA